MSLTVIRRQKGWVTSSIVLKTGGPALWLSLSQTPQHSWSPPSRLPAPGCEARRWLFRLGCRLQREAELDASQNRTTPSQRPDRRHHIIASMKRKSIPRLLMVQQWSERTKLTRMVWDAMLCARALGIPILTAPSARASAKRYTCGEQPASLI